MHGLRDSSKKGAQLQKDVKETGKRKSTKSPQAALAECAGRRAEPAHAGAAARACAPYPQPALLPRCWSPSLITSYARQAQV